MMRFLALCARTCDGDVVYANSRYVGVFCQSTGPKTIRLPGRYSVTDALTDQPLGRDMDTIASDGRTCQTRIFRLD